VPLALLPSSNQVSFTISPPQHKELISNNIIALAVIPGWFSKKRGTAYGILATGSSIGGVTLPIMVNRLIRSIGFGWAMRITAFIILGLLIVVNLTVTAYRPPQPRKLTAKQFWHPFTDFKFAMLGIGIAIFTWGMYVPMNYLQVDAVANGMDPHLVQYLVAIFGAGSLFGRLLSGVFGDIFGMYNVFILVCYIASALILALWLPAGNDAARIAFAVLYGFFSGAYVSQLPALVAIISPVRDMGVRTGLIFLCSAIPALTSNPIAGAILGDNNNWHGAKAFAGVMCAAGTCVIVGTRMSLAKGKGLFAKV
jgi:MFS family permease